MSGMKHCTGDERVEAVLRTLRTAEPQPGMEQRILAALHNAEQLPPKTRRRFWLMSPYIPVISIVACALLVCTMLWHSRFAPTPTQMTGMYARTLTRPIPLEQRNEVIPKGKSVLPFKPLLSRRPFVRSVRDVQYQHVRLLQPTEEQSFPAPPLPLTEQERLLLRLVHGSDQSQLAQMTSSARAVKLQREQDDVTNFFAAPPQAAPVHEGQQ